MKGFIIHIAAKHDPMMSALYIDTIGAMIMFVVPMMLVIYRLKAGLCYDYFKPPQKNKPLFEFLYRFYIFPLVILIFYKH